MAALWGVAVPVSLYLTRGIGATIQQTLLQYPEPQALDRTIDVEGALAAAEAAMLLVPLRPVSPTVAHLKSLVLKGALALRSRHEAAVARLEQRSVSRLFRPPCFRKENRLLRADTHTLRCRVQLFLSLVSVFPAGCDPSAFRPETASERTNSTESANTVPMNWQRQLYSAFHSTLTASQEIEDSDEAYQASSDTSSPDDTT